MATLNDSFGVGLEVRDYSEHALATGTDARAAAYVICALPDGLQVWGCGIDEDVGQGNSQRGERRDGIVAPKVPQIGNNRILGKLPHR